MAVQSLTLSVAGMSCQHCKKAVEEALLTLEGVESAAVDLNNNNAKVVFDPQKTSEKDLKDAVISAGYEVK